MYREREKVRLRGVCVCVCPSASARERREKKYEHILLNICTRKKNFYIRYGSLFSFVSFTKLRENKKETQTRRNDNTCIEFVHLYD